MKDNITPKLVLAIALLLGLSFAVWSGLRTPVETPATSAQHNAFSTPF
jgi:hypothetical protein